ncbi:MAG: sarcosine oxidase subunit gamma family protein [Hyphomicrobiaceae bacterium]|nr:sarcosine oxidase subunit gamma family protein [Hyphomicrobiaceae bacterium]
MAEAHAPLAPAPAFTTLGRLSTPGLSIAPVDDLTIIGVTSFRQTAAETAARLRATVGIAPPDRPQRRSSGPLALQWAGPAQWWLMANGADASSRARDLRHRLDGLAAVVDQSDARAVVHVAGPHARDVLAKGAPVDLHPRAFAIGDVAITQAAHIGVTIALLDHKPTFEITLFRSYADSFAGFLLEAAGEYL